MNIKQIKSQLSEEARREQRIRLRMALVALFMLAGFVVVIARAVDLHCFKSSALKKIASRQYSAVIPQSSRRGKVLDSNGRELAVSLPVKSIYADPKMVASPDETAKSLSRILKLDEKWLLGKLKSSKRFAWLLRRAPEQLATEATSIHGIYSLEESRRSYPNGELAGHLLGAVGYESEPLGGLELSYDRFLSSRRRDATYKRDARGRFYFSPIGYEEQDDVSDVYLTVDKRIQYAAEHALKKAVESSNARAGSAIVMDASSGAILAMANLPVFDPNNYSKYAQDNWRNRAVTDMMEPGSTFKVFVVAAALEMGLVKPETVFDCGEGVVTVDKRQLHDIHPYGRLPVADIIKVSSNIGAYKVAREIGRERFYVVLKKFRMGEDTGVGLPGEAEGIVRPMKTWRMLDLATMAFGQGISATAIQLTSAFAAVVNGGRLMRPYVVNRVVNNQGIVTFKNEPFVVSEPISPATSATMISLLERVVEGGGTGTAAASREYKVAGKTGTAQKVGEGTGQYVEGRYYSSFIGFAPSNNPRIVVFVGIDEPQGTYYGGVVAAPAFREITEATLKYLAVPSSLSKVILVSAEPVKGVQIGESHGGKKRFLKRADGSLLVPDLSGANIREVLEAVGQADVVLKVDGSGLAFDQYPPAGGELKEGSSFQVSFRQPD